VARAFAVFLFFLGCVCGFQKFRQRNELVFPEGAIVFDPLGRVFHRFRREAAAVDATVDFATEQAGGLEDAQMLRNGWERDIERSGQFRDGRFALGKAGKDSAASRVGECAKGGIQKRRRIVNHMV
jgi:hypothetical protein